MLVSVPWQKNESGLRLAIRLTPNARQSKIEDIAVDEKGLPVLRIKVAAQPIEGKANAALMVMLSKTLGIPKSCIKLLKGETSRTKQVQLIGESNALEVALREKLSG